MKPTEDVLDITYPANKPKEWVYVNGVDRNDQDRVSHTYCGPSYGDLRGPLCWRGWNRSDGEAFSILRGWTGERGHCRICQKREAEGLGPVAPSTHKTKWL